MAFILPSNNASAAENTPLVDKVQITNIGNNEYIDYGQGKSIEFMHIKTQHSKDMHMTKWTSSTAGTTFTFTSMAH